MDVKKVLHMNAGEGETSYARNSLRQRSSILKTKPLIESAMQQFFLTRNRPQCICVADLGCSSGPNSLLPTEMILEEVRSSSPETKQDVHVYLNDLPGNDFNMIHKAVPDLMERMQACRVFVSVTAGSFYDRLFPEESLHFLYSGNALHWLSQVPPRVQNELRYLNKEEIGLGKTSNRAIYEAYAEQFNKDFTSFLKLRSQEIVPGGRAILALNGRISRVVPSELEDMTIADDISSVMRELTAEGIIEEDKMVSFNMPYYGPHIDELKEIIQDEGSFDIIQLEEVREASKLDTMIERKLMANGIRAFLEPMLASHFGERIMDEVFERFTDKFSKRSSLKMIGLFLSLARKS